MAQQLQLSKQGSPSRQRYTALSQRPSYILAFLLPMIVYYEIALYTADKNIQIKAHDALVRFFERFDMPPTQGLFLGGVAIVTILAIKHIMSNDRWSIEPRVILGMVFESIILTLPLIAIGSVLAGVLAAMNPSVLTTLRLSERIAVSLGAGLYEEFIFRWLLITGVHTLVCNVLKQSNLAGITSGIIISSITFAMYHDFPDFNTLGVVALLFYGIAGVYLGLIYINRGFGIAAGTHAAYDIVATTLLASIAA